MRLLVLSLCLALLFLGQASARALRLADQGQGDGVGLRIKGLEKKVPNLRRVLEKLMDNEFVAYSLNSNLKIDDGSALAPYDIAYVLDRQIFEKTLANHRSVIRARNAEQLFELLAADLVPKAAAALVAMKADGIYGKIFYETRSVLAQSS